jgi:hypothetical protein
MSRTRFPSSFALGLAALCWMVASNASAEVQVLKDIPFSQDIEVRAAVREKCELGTKLSGFIAEYGTDVTRVDELGSGRVLDLSITQVHASGGGVFSGPKWLEVQGTLKQAGKPVASFRGKRFSGGGAFGVFKGTCAIIGRTTQALGKDIGTWLANPVDGANLGDAR